MYTVEQYFLTTFLPATQFSPVREWIAYRSVGYSTGIRWVGDKWWGCDREEGVDSIPAGYGTGIRWVGDMWWGRIEKREFKKKSITYLFIYFYFL